MKLTIIEGNFSSGKTFIAENIKNDFKDYIIIHRGTTFAFVKSYIELSKPSNIILDDIQDEKILNYLISTADIVFKIKCERIK